METLPTRTSSGAKLWAGGERERRALWMIKLLEMSDHQRSVQFRERAGPSRVLTEGEALAKTQAGRDRAKKTERAAFHMEERAGEEALKTRFSLEK